MREERRRALREAIADLKRYGATYDLDAFLLSRDAQRQAIQALFVASQACVDEALAACATRGLDGGLTYKEAFLKLGEAGVLDAGLAVRLSRWASFRNVLAHFYPVIDLHRVHGALTDVGDLEAFEAWLASH